MHEHGSDVRRFVRGAWTGCKCGYDPHDNALLNAHFAEHGFREVDVHGTIRRFPVESVSISMPCPYCTEHTLYKPTAWVEGGPALCANPDCASNRPPEDLYQPKNEISDRWYPR
jgi:hypothetical protein